MSKVKLSVYVPKELHRQAKFASLERGTTMQYLVEDALQRSLDPSRPAAPSLKPKEIQMLISQFRQILHNRNELYIASVVSCIRGTFGLLQAEKKVTSIQKQPAPGEATGGKATRERSPTPAVQKTA